MKRVLCLLLLLAACSSDDGRKLVDKKSWTERMVPSGRFEVAVFMPPIQRTPRLTVYIEGDGHAWSTRFIASNDPTPDNPIALKLAQAQPTGTAVYLSRPCQYNVTPTCQTPDWTSHRFSAEMIQAENRAIDSLKETFGAYEIVLVGYSGGGAVAALLAASRYDVVKLITVAGNLDHAEWTKLQNLAPLSGSLNPADYAVQLARIPQVHFVGADDRTMPVEVARSYASRFPPDQQPTIKVLDDHSHNAGWIESWPELWPTIAP